MILGTLRLIHFRHSLKFSLGTWQGVLQGLDVTPFKKTITHTHTTKQ